MSSITQSRPARRQSSSAVRTTLASREAHMPRVMEVLNNTIYNNVQRMGSGKNLTLALLDYRPSPPGNGRERGQLRISGQHETVIVARSDGRVEIIDTDELGFPIGLVEDMVQFVNEERLSLSQDDVVVLYTDGITEAADEMDRSAIVPFFAVAGPAQLVGARRRRRGAPQRRASLQLEDRGAAVLTLRRNPR
jgi:hypothetical protein